MSQQVDGGTKTFVASAALEKFRRVRLDSNNELAYAGASDTDCIGVTIAKNFAAGDQIAVWLRNKEGTVICTSSEAIAITDTLYAAADGKVATTGTVLVGEPLEAVSGAGDYLEVALATTAVLGAIARTALTQDDLKPYAIPLTLFRVHDALQTNLPGTAATDDLAVITGTIGSDPPSIQGVDFGGTTTTAYARIQYPLPPEYVDGQTVTLRVNAGMLTTVSDGTCTLDAVVYRNGAGSDICATAAQSINSLTFADKDFTITPTALVAGDLLDIRLVIAGSDTGNAGVMIPEIASVTLLMDIKG
ncbi:MAG: hypothetical protein AMXMBFR84_37800 [Candidatus Hydrogenedentota bacterium]